MSTEVPNIAEVLKSALAAVKAADIPPELQSTALEKAIDLIAEGGGAPATKPPVGNGSKQHRGHAASDASLGDESVLGKIAERLKLERVVVEEVFHHDGDDLEIVLGTAKFDQSKRAGTIQIALLLAAGRQAGGLEEWTSVKDIRELAKDFGRFDQANFANTITKMDNVFMYTGSSTADRKVKVSRQGYERAVALITALTGGEAS
jgi:hypothetical protein